MVRDTLRLVRVNKGYFGLGLAKRFLPVCDRHRGTDELAPFLASVQISDC